MDLFTNHAALSAYCIAVAILVLKAMASSIYSGIQRQRHKGYANPEDARLFGDNAASVDQEVPAVAHALRIQRNDSENLPAFFAIGLVYALSGASANGANWYFGVYVVSRIIHTIFYSLHLQPWRAISYIAGFLCLVGMSVQVLLHHL